MYVCHTLIGGFGHQFCSTLVHNGGNCRLSSLAALFYPSVRVMTEFQDIGIISEWMKFPRLLAESYYDHYHAILPQDADSGNTDISAQ